MNAEDNPTSLEEDARYLRANLAELQERVSSLTEAVQRDLAPKFNRIETMVHALERDAKEAAGGTGASRETARELRSVVEKEFARLKQEAESHSIGNPTTVSAALDGILHFVEASEKKLKKLTGRVSIGK